MIGLAKKIHDQLNNVYSVNKLEAFETASVYVAYLAQMVGHIAPDKVELEVGLQEFMQDFRRLAYEAFEKSLCLLSDYLKKMVTQAELKEILHYAPETGVFTWRISCGTQKAGNIAGSIRKDKLPGNPWYIHIKINNRKHAAHRLAWLYMKGYWPTDQLDHANGNSLDNTFTNIRECSQSQNLGNRRKNRNNTSGYKGVCWNGWNWSAVIGFQGEYFYLGSFTDPAEAHQAYIQKAKELFGEFARAE